VSDLEARRFRRNLTAVLSLVGLLTAGSVFLFGHLLFKTLSKDVVDEAILYSRQDALRIARGLAERAAGDVYTLKVQQKDVDVFVGSALSDRQVLSEVRVYDSKNQLVYAYTGLLSRPERARPRPEGGQTLATDPVEPSSRSSETTAQITDPYGIEVPIGDFGTLKVGVSQRELQARVEVLRGKLYKRIFAAAVVSFLGILAASWAVMLLVRRTRKVEAARVEAERRAELGEVATGLAHEIRNPLNSALLALKVAARRLGAAPPSSALEGVDSARGELERIERLLTDFLWFARPVSANALPGRLSAPAEAVARLVSAEVAERGIELTTSFDAGASPVAFDEDCIRQVIFHLVRNAIEAASAGGHIAVRVRACATTTELDVEDDGPGIAGDVARLFVPFHTTKSLGTGLGLTIVQRIAADHGGEIRVESAPGRTVFTLALPALRRGSPGSGPQP